MGKAADGLASGIAEAILNGAPLPAINKAYSLNEAYILQHAVTRAVTATNVAGIKAGVTAPAAQEFFGLDHALLGSLYDAGQVEQNGSIDFVPGRLIECELAVLVDKNAQPISVAPAVEFVRVNFERPEDLTAANLVLSNLGAELFIVGEFLPWERAGEEISVSLWRGSDVVNQADMFEALGGPVEAAPWMCDEAIKRGFRLNGNTLLLTGACGTAVAADKGHYVAEYGSFGKLTFEVK